MEDIDRIIEALKLQPHPEGGYYRETFRSEETMNGRNRNLVTAIYFLLTSENVSNFHRIKSDELWFHHAGSPLIVHTLDAAGHHQHLVGNNVEAGKKTLADSGLAITSADPVNTHMERRDAVRRNHLGGDLERQVPLPE